jgi:hypothetical protein
MNNITTTKSRKNTRFYSLLTVLIAIIVGVTLLNPLWAIHSPPFDIPKVLPAITAPVDGPFYLWNAEYGYQWDNGSPLSLWFHPLMSWLVMIMPAWLPNNMWFWLISVFFAVGAVILTHQLAAVLAPSVSLPARFLPLVLLAVGGLGLATGNAEIPTLFFATALLLSILHWQVWWLTAIFAALAILTKPNALYLIPIMGVYFVFGVLTRDTLLWRQAFWGMVTLIITWIAWMLLVDYNSGQIGTYWNTRLTARQYVAGDAWNFFRQLVISFILSDDVREQIRYSTALIIPLVSIWTLGVIPFSNEIHRYAAAIGYLSMMIIALIYGNPNKIIVYVTTLPSHFVVHLLFIRELWLRSISLQHPVYPATGMLYLIYCLAMLAIYVFGTPLGWYY